MAAVSDHKIEQIIFQLFFTLTKLTLWKCTNKLLKQTRIFFDLLHISLTVFGVLNKLSGFTSGFANETDFSEKTKFHLLS